MKRELGEEAETEIERNSFQDQNFILWQNKVFRFNTSSFKALKTLSNLWRNFPSRVSQSSIDEMKF